MATLKARLNTAEHIFFRLLKDKFNAQPKGLQLGEESTRIVVESKNDLTQVPNDRFEAMVNEIINKDLEVKEYELSRKEAEKIVSLSFVPEKAQAIRIIDISGFDVEACATPHVNRTNEIGCFKILNAKKAGKDSFSITFTVIDKNKTENKIKNEIKSDKMDLQLAKGVRDIPPEEKIVVNRILNTLKTTFERYGFVPLETPLLERWETFTAKGGAGEESEALKETFKLKDQGNRNLALRFDLTVPLARYVAMNSQLKMPFKRYEMGPVFRDGPLKLGRYRQFWQCDVDTIGVKGMLAEAEQLALVQNAFQSLGIDIIIKVNNRKLINGILEQCGITEKESAIIAIDKLEKIGAKGVTEELLQRGYSEDQSKNVLRLLKEKISLKELKKKVKSPEGVQGLQELEELFGYLKNMKVKSVQFEASLARGLGYYTGTVFEVFAIGSPVTSSIAGGGRYDQMVGKFAGGGREIPAVGIAFGLSTILDVIKAKQEFKEKSLAKAYVIPIQTIKESLQLIKKLRAKGVCVDMDLNSRGVGKNLEYASAMGIPYCLILGSDEVKQKKVLLRDMINGKQELLKVGEVVKKLRKDKS